MIQLSIITVNYYSAELLQRLIQSIQTLDLLPTTEWIVVDNSPSEQRLDQFLEFPAGVIRHQIIENPANPGFGAACNLGASHAAGEILLLLNPDCTFCGGSFSKIMVRLVSEENLGAVGPRLEDSTGKAEHSFAPSVGVISEARIRTEKRLRDKLPLVRRLVESHYSKPCRVDWITGAALFIKKSAYLTIGGFDEKFFLYFEDADLCKRLSQSGFKVCFDPSFRMIHDKGSSLEKARSTVERHYRLSQIYYYKTHKNPLSRILLQGYLKLTGKYPK